MALTIAQAVRKILVKEPFYGLFLMGLNKYFDDKVSTACVKRNGINIEIAINKDYWDSLSESLEINVLLHETLHIVFRHLGMNNDFPDVSRFRIATDCHVNSFLWEVSPTGYHPKDFGLKTGLGTKYYYENLPKDLDDGPNNHDWKDFKDLTDTEKQLLSNQVDYLLKETVAQLNKTQGKIPNYLKEYLDKLFQKKSRIFNGKSYFRRLVGTIQDIELKKTRKRESIRFPDASGLKHKRKSNICVVIDTSGSVSNKELTDFFAEIHHIGKAGADITIIENDATIQNISKYNGKGNGEVRGRGGTVFNDCVNGYNAHCKDFNTIIFFTDGYADVDLQIIGPNIGVITSNGKQQKYPGQTLYIPKEN